MTRLFVCFGMVLAVIAVCSCSGDNAVSSKEADLPMAFSSETSRSGWTPSDTTAVLDTMYVDLTGTRIRLVNSSGGNLIATNKDLIVVPDWNIRAWLQSNPKRSVDVTSFDWRLYVTSHWQMDLHCLTSDGVPDTQHNVLRGIKFTGEPFVAWADPSSDRSSPCLGEDLYLTFHDRHSVWHRGDGTISRQGGYMKFINDTIPLHDTRAFKAPELVVTYHPVSEDSAHISRDTAFLEGVLEERWGYRDEITRMFPVVSYVLRDVGQPLVVPLDPNADSMIENVLHALDEVVPSRPATVVDGVLYLNVAIVNSRVKRVYSNDWTRIDPASGIAFQGGTLSAVYHEPSHADEGPRNLIHELGHNLNLIHTHENPDYPRYPSSDINRDGYRVLGFREVYRVDRNIYADFMSYNDPAWVSEYSWNQMVRYIENDQSALAARALVRVGRDGKQVKIWTEDHTLKHTHGILQ